MIDLEKILHDYENKHIRLQNPKQVKSGKEATVFMVFLEDKPLALKVYINPKVRAFQQTGVYLTGKHYRKYSEEKAIRKKNTFGKRLIHKNWIRREYYLLDKLSQLGAHVPHVYGWTEDSIIMDFIGDEFVGPRLIDVILTEDQAKLAFDSILKDIQIFLKLGIIHGDLSPYNILWWKETPWIIDVPQAIDVRLHPNKNELLKRDLDNIISYFSRYIKINSEDIYKLFKL